MKRRLTTQQEKGPHEETDMNQLIVFWNENSSSIVVSFVVGFIFFVLGPIGVWFSGRKIRRERVQKAKDLLIDLVEGMIVSHEEITLEKLKKMYRAIEREVDVSIDSHYDLERLFEDVMLRFQRSKHLDSEQKDTYAKKLSELTDLLSENAQRKEVVNIPKSYEKLFTELSKSIDSNDKDAINVSLEQLKKRVSRSNDFNDPILNIFGIYLRILREKPALFVVSLILAIALYAIILQQLGLINIQIKP